MSEERKKAVSLRLSTADLRKIKRISERLEVRDSDVIRFAVKAMLARLSPLSDPAICGRSLVPLLLDSGTELMRHFDLDAEKLDKVVNTGVAEAAKRVEIDDLHILAMIGGELGERVASMPLAPTLMSGAHPAPGYQANGRALLGLPERRGNGMRHYLYEKYMRQPAPAPNSLLAANSAVNGLEARSVGKR